MRLCSRLVITVLLPGLLSSTSVAAQGSSTTRTMEDPLFGLSYDPRAIHFSDAPKTVGQRCSDLRKSHLWVFGSFKTASAEYYLVSRFVHEAPDLPDAKAAARVAARDSEPDNGTVVAIAGLRCSTSDLMFALSGSLPSDSLPDGPEWLPGSHAKDICDSRGNCHYEFRSRAEAAILEGLEADALNRYAEAFGGEGRFRERLHRQFPDSEAVSKVNPTLQPFIRRVLRAKGLLN